MVKSLHRSLEAKLASIKDPDYSESENEADDRQPETISAKRAATGRGGNKERKQGNDKKDVTSSQPPSANDSDEPSTVIYLGHLPVGFEEREITAFLNQFGNVNRCRVSRSTKTGRSRCYAFVEFADPEVATIVADTMSGYLLLEKRLVCHVMPRDKVNHELMFARPKRVPTKKDRQKKARTEVNKVRSADAIRGITARLVKREEMKRKKLGTLGIEYHFPGYVASAAAAAAAAAQPSVTTTTTSKKDDNVSSMKNKKKRKLPNNGGEEKDDARSGNQAPSLESLKKKEKKNKKGGLEKSGGEEEVRMENAVTNDHAEEKKKKKNSMKVDLKEKSGEKGEKRKEIDVTNDRSEEAANGESAKKKTLKKKAKTLKKG
ncbi:hypothetical protein ACHAW5_010780 [Stephanodiscus triporus]|uniref:RRM domain-containing protein n=1 Tax=Stephanodiscus triporus TaxID=2934178 RepID=A0ABD3PXE7_9STRA